MAFISDKTRQGASGLGGGYEIDNSLRFNQGDSAYLSRTFGTATNKKIWTWSCWFKLGEMPPVGNSNDTYLFAAGTGGTQSDSWYFISNGALSIGSYSGGYAYRLNTTQYFRDPSAWYHFVVEVDTTIASPSGTNQRIKLWVNGSQVTDFSTETYPSLNAEFHMNSAEPHEIGKYIPASSGFADGYMAEINFVDGQSLDPSNFGEFGDYGEWKPVEYKGTHGTNGFYLDFKNTSTVYSLSTFGSPTHRTAQSKIGGSSIEFNAGTTDCIAGGANSDFNFNTGDFTIESWFRSSAWTNGAIACYGTSSSTSIWRIGFTGSGAPIFHWNSNTDWNFTNNITASSTASLNTWHHVAIVRSGSTVQLFLDGVSQGTSTTNTVFGTSTKDLWFGTHFNEPTVTGSSSSTWSGYLDEIRISSTARYTSGFTPSTTAFVDDTDTMLLIHSDTTNGSTTFADSSGVGATLGNDASSNSNNWTSNNLAATDQMVDTPTNNFCTLNPLDMSGTSSVFKNGNLHAVNSTNQYAQTFSTFVMDSGKWYAEGCLVDVISGSPQTHMGIKTGTGANAAADRWLGEADPGTYDGVTNLWTKAQGTVVAAAIDVDAGKAWFHDGTSWLSGDPSAGTSPSLSSLASPIRMAMDSANSEGLMWNFGQDSSFAGNKTAQGNQDGNGIGDFYYAPPTGFLALCTANLPDPTVIPSEHFNTVLYSGNNSTQVITGVGFQPDLAWFKARGSASSHQIADSVRGVSKLITSNGSGGESTGTDITSFDSDGYTLAAENQTGSINGSGESIVAWNWKGGGTAVSNTSGTMTSQVSANTDAGFSVITYTGNTSTNQSVGHGLNSAPELIFIKKTGSAENWGVIGSTLGVDKILTLNDQSAFGSGSGNYPLATSSVVYVSGSTVPSRINWSNGPFVAYAFHSVAGHSKCGTYIGNGSPDGTFVFTDFRPAFIMTKWNGNDGWTMIDATREPYNVTGDNCVFANTSNAEFDPGGVDFDLLSNGFKLRNTDVKINQSGGTYVYIAFAEHPFKHTNAR